MTAKRRITLLLILIICFCAALFMFSKQPVHMGIQEFIETYKSKVSSFDIYYYTWNAPVELAIISEETVINASHLRVSGNFIYSFCLKKVASELARHLGEKCEKKRLDFRYSCQVSFYGGKKVIRFSIPTSLDVIVINGQPYHASPELIDCFLRLLPVKDYEIITAIGDSHNTVRHPIC